jgi:hypothetical protein
MKFETFKYFLAAGFMALVLTIAVVTKAVPIGGPETNKMIEIIPGVLVVNANATIEDPPVRCEPGVAVCVTDSGLQIIDGFAEIGGSVEVTGTIVSTNTESIGWSIVDYNNRACNVTCTHACVFGFDEDDQSLVDCSDSAADKCICAGAN